MFDGTEGWCNIEESWLVLSKNFFYRLKISDFILESKMAKLNWMQNLLIYFENCPVLNWIFPILMSRNRLMNTFRNRQEFEHFAKS